MLIVFLTVLALWTSLRLCRRGHRDWHLLRQYRYAHRGLHDKPSVPENSMAAFRRAVEKGYGSELDVHLMKDGQLAVCHDASLLRTAGVDVKIESLTAEDLKNYTLEESAEHIPLFREVLELYAGRAPLIVELKPEGGNHEALARAAAALLDAYDGPYCIESFDPRAVAWFKKNRPAVCRGQLSENFAKTRSGSLPPWLRFAMTHLLVNVLSRPDFVAYRYEDRKLWSFRLHRLFHRPRTVYWTIASREEMAAVEKDGAVCIFEGFAP